MIILFLQDTFWLQRMQTSKITILKTNNSEIFKNGFVVNGSVKIKIIVILTRKFLQKLREMLSSITTVLNKGLFSH